METRYNRILITADSDWVDPNKVNEVIQAIFQKCFGYEVYVKKKRDKSKIDYTKKVEKEDFPKVLNDPFIFVRDRKSDNRLKFVLTHFGYRVIQFRADWDNDGDSAGINRNERMFNTTYKVDIAICLTKFQQNDDGMAHIINECITRDIPVIICDIDPVLISGKKIKKEYKFDFKSFLSIPNLETTIIPKPSKKEKYTELTEVDKNILKYGSDEWKRKMEQTRKMMKQIYFSSKNNRPSAKELSNEDFINGCIKKSKNNKIKSSARTKARKVNKKINVKKLKIKTTDLEVEESFDD